MNVLFVCNYNSARSQMAAAFFNHYATEGSTADSAGITPGMLSMLAVKVMAEKEIDLFGAPVKGIDEVLENGNRFTHLIIIGDETVAERCPDIEGIEEKQSWNLPDPSTFEGSQDELETLLKNLRDEIEERVKGLLEG